MSEEKKEEMSNDDNESLFVDFSDLDRAKIEARERLLAMPPAEAQKLVNQTLYPEYWSYDPKTHCWEESIPTHYGEDI